MRTQPATGSSSQLGGTLGVRRHDWRRRLLLHHVPLAIASTAGLILFMGLLPSHGRGISISQFVVATGYVALVLLALTLLIGPVNLLLFRRNPVSSYLRRDVGAWTAIVSVVHVIFGFETHGDGGIFSFLDFFVADGRPLTNSFGLGNWTGLAATVIVVGLLVNFHRPFSARTQSRTLEKPPTTQLHLVCVGCLARGLLWFARAHDIPPDGPAYRHRYRGPGRTRLRNPAVAAEILPPAAAAWRATSGRHSVSPQGRPWFPKP